MSTSCMVLSVCKIPITEASVGNLCIACRRRICLDEVVPPCTNRLRDGPLGGENYGGELAYSLRHLPRHYWNKPTEKNELLEILCGTYDGCKDEELKPILLSI